MLPSLIWIALASVCPGTVFFTNRELPSAIPATMLVLKTPPIFGAVPGVNSDGQWEPDALKRPGGLPVPRPIAKPTVAVR